MALRWKTLSLLLVLLSPLSLAYDPNVPFLLNDSLCDRTLNESRLNSNDCPLTAKQVWDCASDQTACVDDHLFRDLTVFLVLVAGVLVAIRFKDRLRGRRTGPSENRKMKHIRRAV